MNKEAMANIVRGIRDLIGSLMILADDIEKATAGPGDEQLDGHEDASSISMASVRDTLSALSRSGHASDVRDLIHSFGGERLSDISPDDYPELLSKAEVLLDAT